MEIQFELEPRAQRPRLRRRRSAGSAAGSSRVLLAPTASGTAFVLRGSSAVLGAGWGIAPCQPQRNGLLPVAASVTAASAAAKVPVSVSVTAAAAKAAAAKAPPALLKSQQVQNLLAGGLAGAVSKSLVAPLERISTIMAVGRRMSVEQAAQAAWRDGGALGLWRGNGATILKIFPASAVNFAVFHSAKDFMIARKASVAVAATTAAGGAAGTGVAGTTRQQRQPDLAPGERLMAGAMAGAASGMCTYPLESLRTLMALQKGSLLGVASRVVRSQGISALYKGFRCSVMNDMLGNALGFSLFEFGCRLYEQTTGAPTVPAHARGMIGSLAAAATLTATSPLEIVRRRLQVQGQLGRPVLYRGTLDCFRCILRDEGLAGFYCASLPLYLKVAPSIGCMYALFDILQRRMSEAAGPPAHAADPA